MEAVTHSVAHGGVARSAFFLRALSDKSLTRLSASGSEDAFGVLYERYQGPIFAYCSSILRDYNEAEDALHEVMLRTHQALRGSEREIEIKPWLYRCARNHCLNLIQRRKHLEGPVSEMAETGERVDTIFEQNMELREVLDDMAHLPEEQRAALVMREASGLSHVAIAEALNIDTAKAKRLLFEARRALCADQEGRQMECSEIRYRLSEGDGRTSRQRTVRSHLKACQGCADFQRTLGKRKAVLRAGLPILAPEAAAAILAKVFSSVSAAEAATSAAGATAAGVATGKAAGGAGLFGNLLGGGAAVKGAAVLAAAAVVGGGGYVVSNELGLGGSENAVQQEKAGSPSGGGGDENTAGATDSGDKKEDNDSGSSSGSDGSGDEGQSGNEKNSQVKNEVTEESDRPIDRVGAVDGGHSDRKAKPRKKDPLKGGQKGVKPPAEQNPQPEPEPEPEPGKDDPTGGNPKGGGNEDFCKLYPDDPHCSDSLPD